MSESGFVKLTILVTPEQYEELGKIADHYCTDVLAVLQDAVANAAVQFHENYYKELSVPEFHAWLHGYGHAFHTGMPTERQWRVIQNQIGRIRTPGRPKSSD